MLIAESWLFHSYFKYKQNRFGQKGAGKYLLSSVN